MIKINLLPREQRKREPKVNLKLIGGVALGIFALAGMGYFWWTLKGEVDRLKHQIDEVKQELQRNTELAKQVEQYKADKKKLEERLQVVERLSASQSGPVKLLDQLSLLLPSEVWFTALSKTSDRLVLQGYALSNFAVANLMINMGKAAPLFQNVELSYTEKATIEKVPVEKFEITAEVR